MTTTTHEVSTDDLAADRSLRVAAVFGGSLAAIVGSHRILIMRVPELDPVAEIGIDGDSHANDVAFLEDGSRLAVLSRSPGAAVIHVVDPTGPHKLGDLPVQPTSRIVAVAGGSLLVAGTACALIDLSRNPLSAMTLPLRAPLAAGGRLTAGRLIVASGGAVEEWDVALRAPVRRLRIDRPIDPEHVGGNGQRIWMVLRSAPNCVEIISLTNRSTRRIELPESVAHVIPHPVGDLLVIIAAESRTAYLLDLVRDRSLVALEVGPVHHAAWLGHTTLLTYPIDGKLTVVTVPMFGRTTANVIEIPNLVDGVATREPEAPTPLLEPQSRERAPGPSQQESSILIEVPRTLLPSSPALPRKSGWRGDLIAWARGARRSAPEGSPVAHVIERLELGDNRLAIALLYSARLLGTDGISSVELASVVGWEWEEALGAGELVARHLMYRRRERWHLEHEIAAFLDERPPCRGTVVMGQGTSPGNVAIVAPRAIELERVASEAAPRIGSLLVPDARGELDPARFLLEARVRGVIALVPWDRWNTRVRWPAFAAIVVASHQRANELGLPIVATLEEGS